MTEDPTTTREIAVTVNGRAVQRTVPVRRLLVDFLRDDLGHTGTHAGCEHGVCGACTVLVDGEPARSCITLAVQADGTEVTTIEGLTPPDGLSPLQQAFKDRHALQCGFCTPGIIATLSAADPDDHPDDESIRQLLAGNLCRCTGYHHIVDAVKQAWGRTAT
ncbi:(2Fe-2S)-binding protein [Saccharopolyspora hordei]|uniref:Carbon-monoxide dehydrogenase small subunit n=1 Tax=Saccharopolyspora hordei TaxID=1838 RepID=A0A853AK55_9PSEU|nr:(2Fe-2S)-binding protein [Saccharopolyspora hordei]NYI84166.1 carbon-monoxide dehydrogenase small subunit [Saccharopolyspora hordei]